MVPSTPILMRLATRGDVLTLNPDKGPSVLCVLVLCTLIICWEREKHWEHKDELPLRLTVAGTILFIYSIWWQAASHGWLWLYETFTVISALGIIAAVVMAWLNGDAKLRRILLWAAPLPAILFLIFHTPAERPPKDDGISPEIKRIMQKVNAEQLKKREGQGGSQDSPQEGL